MQRWAIILVPVLLIGLIYLALGLRENPKEIPSPLVGKTFPEYNTQDLDGEEFRLSGIDARPMIVNVWASWCVACRTEHPVINKLSRQYGDRVRFIGLNYKDKLDDAKRWLDQYGDPYARSAFDHNGRIGIDLGVYGVPETFFVSTDGRIIDKHIGPLTEPVLTQKLNELLNAS